MNKGKLVAKDKTKNKKFMYCQGKLLFKILINYSSVFVISLLSYVGVLVSVFLLLCVCVCFHPCVSVHVCVYVCGNSVCSIYMNTLQCLTILLGLESVIMNSDVNVKVCRQSLRRILKEKKKSGKVI